MKVVRFSLIVCVILAGVSPIAADDTLYRYEGDVHPLDESAGWIVGNLCEDPCTASVKDGHFILTWDEPNDIVNYGFRIATPETPPPPSTLWVEWRFRSNHPIGENFFTCDGEFSIDYAGAGEVVFMYGDTAISFSGDDVVTGLNLEEFHTYRYESVDGLNYRVSVDGKVFIVACCNAKDDFHSIALRGIGACDGFHNTINEWDFVRFGTIGSGEKIIATDPPAGLIDSDSVTFKVTFDSASYVYIDDITVEVTGGIPPTIIATRRAEGDEPDTVEIVLDGPPPAGETTTFKFDTGLPVNCDPGPGEIVNCVEYTLPPPLCGDGVTNQPGEECDGSDDVACPGGCRADCTCPVCGDGVVEGDEECDASGESKTCDVGCTLAVCGDGTTNVTAGEACDNGPDNSDIVPDACRETCMLASCGDSVADSGEECDDGPGNSDTTPDACRTDCTSAGCGDGVLDTGEACDEGTLNSDTRPDRCRVDCTLPICGDGVTDSGEACDDAAASATCDGDCTLAACGDGTLNITAGEECDDGPTNSDTAPDTCRTDCVLPNCGDSVTDTGEDCDDGAESTTCDADCSLAECGDGTLNVTAGEACDDGSSNSDSSADACRTNCKAATCGDNVTDTGEECDGIDDSACEPRLCQSDCTCPEPGIPTVSQWGLVAMGVLLLMFSRRYFGPRRLA